MDHWNEVFVLLVLFALATNASECPEKFSRNGHFCYRYFDEQKSWIDAEDSCNKFVTSDGTTGHLVSIHNADENELVSTLTALGSTDQKGPQTWIGLHVNESNTDSGVFEWTDTTNVDYSNWNPGEPSSSTSQFCAEINWDIRGNWNDKGCHNVQGFVCQLPVDTTFWTSYEGSLYRFYCDKVTWDEAKTKCESESGHLVIIKDSAENDFVSTLTASSTKKAGQPTWIGLKEKTPVSFAWSDGTNYEGPYDKLCCVHTNDGKSRGNWNNGDCSSKLAFVCERDE